MAKHTKGKNSIGTLIFGLVMAAAVVLGLISILSGKTANSSGNFTAQSSEMEQTEEKKTQKTENTEETEGENSDQTAEDTEEPILDENGEKISFGQVPETTVNADPNEPDVTETTESSAEETVAATETSAAETSAAETSATETAVTVMDGEYPVTTVVTDDWLILANKTHHLSEDYWPEDMVTVSSCVEGVGNNDTKKMRKIAADALEELIEGAAQAGYQIKMRTGFRSYNYQVSLFNSYAQKNGEEAANKYSARAGESEHQTGLCCDVSSPSVSWALSYQYGETEEGKWLAEHCCEYGFILRYLKGKEDITGYVYEPWHIRYVGVDVATEIYNKGICFEEYLGITE